MTSLHTLPAGHTLTATVVDGKGFVRRLDNPAIGGLLTNAAPAVYGPYLAPHAFEVQGAVTVTIAEASTLDNVPSAAQAAMLDAIPTADQEDSATVWNDEGVLKVSTAGV